MMSVNEKILYLIISNLERFGGRSARLNKKNRGRSIYESPGLFCLNVVVIFAFSTNHDSSGTTEHTNRIVDTCNNPYYCKLCVTKPDFSMYY